MINDIFEILQFSFLFSLILCIFIFALSFLSALPDRLFDLLIDWYDYAFNYQNDFLFFIAQTLHYFKYIVLFIVAVVFITIMLFIEISLISKTIEILK